VTKRIAVGVSGGGSNLRALQAAAARGDQQAASALAMTTNRDTCLSGCAQRGHSKDQCVSACRRGLCHPGAEQPYCVAK